MIFKTSASMSSLLASSKSLPIFRSDVAMSYNLSFLNSLNTAKSALIYFSCWDSLPTSSPCISCDPSPPVPVTVS